VIKTPFPKVKEAREALRAQALELYERYNMAIQNALADGEYEVAMDHMRWLIEHMPKGDDGERMIDESAAKPKQVEGLKGPSIQIGIALGGVTKPKELPQAEVIDITSEELDG
jgi:hypothetical protein